MLYRYDGALSPLPLFSFFFPSFFFSPLHRFVSPCYRRDVHPRTELPYRIRSSTVSVTPRLLKLLFILLFFIHPPVVT